MRSRSSARPASSAARSCPCSPSEHDVVAVSRSGDRGRQPSVRERVSATSPTGRRAQRARAASTSRTTSSTRSARPTSPSVDRRPPRPSHARPSAPASPRSSTSAASATTAPTSRRTCAAESRPRTTLASAPFPVTTLRAAVVVGRGSAGFETIVALVDRLPGDDRPALGLDADPADRAHGRRRLLGGVAGQPRGDRRDIRRRRPGGPDLPRDDRAHRGAPWAGDARSSRCRS